MIKCAYLDLPCGTYPVSRRCSSWKGNRSNQVTLNIRPSKCFHSTVNVCPESCPRSNSTEHCKASTQSANVSFCDITIFTQPRNPRPFPWHCRKAFCFREEATSLGQVERSSHHSQCTTTGRRCFTLAPRSTRDKVLCLKLSSRSPNAKYCLRDGGVSMSSQASSSPLRLGKARICLGPRTPAFHTNLKAFASRHRGN